MHATQRRPLRHREWRTGPTRLGSSECGVSVSSKGTQVVSGRCDFLARLTGISFVFHARTDPKNATNKQLEQVLLAPTPQYGASPIFLAFQFHTITSTVSYDSLDCIIR